ncbi:MAG: 5'/3'-nucleotidase SurE [Magnetospirillum sp.]|nr:5'/3'-nucleotidase SurE [Magnetospirillum sp.]
MFAPLPDLSDVRILVANDDGITAPGIKVLERVARSLSKDVWVVAPENEQSAAGHSLTLRRPLRVRQVSRRRFAVDGTPTDAVLLGINHVLKGRRPALVLSGINRGGNLGEDITYSGTVAAAMEAVILGIPAIALSQQVTPDHPVKWGTAEHWAPDIIRKVTAAGWGRDVLINVNFPDILHTHVTGIEVARQGKRKIGDEVSERTDPRGEPYIWIGGQRADERGPPGTDLETVRRGAIAVTPLCIDLTDRDAMRALEPVFA